MPRDTLRFVHSARPPTTDVRVFDSLTREFLGTAFTFRVVGSSHYVSAPAYDFHELTSCEPVDAEDVATIRLDPDDPPDPSTTGDADGLGGDPVAPGASGEVPTPAATDAPSPRRLRYDADPLRCETLVERRPLSAFPAAASFDLAYWFDDDAATTIALGADGYETYHTYPEFDLALYTRTVFESVPRAAGTGSADGARAAGSSPAPSSTD